MFVLLADPAFKCQACKLIEQEPWVPAQLGLARGDDREASTVQDCDGWGAPAIEDCNESVKSDDSKDSDWTPSEGEE